MASSLVRAIDHFPKLSRVVAILVLVGLNYAGFSRWHRNQNPAFTLNRAADAIRHRDSTAFEVEADVDRLAGSYYDQHLLPTVLRSGSPAEGVRARYVQSIARRLRRWVETSRIDDSESPRLTLLADFLTSALMRGSAVQRSIRSAGGLAIAAVDLADEQNGTLSLEIKLVRQQGHWRIVEITNLEEAIGMLRRVELARIRRLHRIIDNAVAIQPAVFKSARESSGQRLFSYELRLTGNIDAVVQWSAVCRWGVGQAVSTENMRTTLKKSVAVPLIIECPCPVEPCKPPSVIVDELTSGKLTVRRESPKALD
jgi:hypothetical protein